ncbi:hypothetical protein [Brevundimonas mediterranea]|uniref:Uncharacterized protein n=1 Tax=Brevundimonas mediterranea TaxID=74329 RepID=A0A7W6EZ79_9CAUL|nr:hypothetical protein [Brevundimonas mediterranea]MBB3871660.1 hypothetical protein [Brevundimonas mediterranea]
MTDDEIRVAAAEKLLEERNFGATITETTPLAMTPYVMEFAGSLGGGSPAILPVSEDPLGRYGWCNDGVRLKVAAEGGEPVYGWVIWEWAPALLTAEFHCVWRSPEGALIDITPKPRREETIVFVDDAAYPADFDFDQRPRNRRMNIYGPAIRAARLEGLLGRMTPSQRQYETGRAAKAGLSLDQWLARKTSADAVSDAIDGLIAACDEFEVYYDSLGMSGFVRVDQTFAALGRKRLAAQARCKVLLRGLKNPAAGHAADVGAA